MEFRKGVWGELTAVVSESHFFNLETRMRVSPIQSRSSRRDREFLTLTLKLRDETEKKFPPISGIETRSRFIIFTLRHRDENKNSLDLISFFETRPRILKLAIFPWNQAWMASLFCMPFSGGQLYQMQGPTFCYMFSHFEMTQSCSIFIEKYFY